MAKVKVTARFQILEFIDRFVDGATANAIGKTVVTEAKAMIAEGQSPVRGHGRFEAYKAQGRATAIEKERKAAVKGTSAKSLERFAANAKASAASAAAKKGYPWSAMGKYPDKKVRPVNLELSGEMLDALTFRVLPSKNAIEVGIIGGSADVKERAKAHHDGTKDMARRRFIPGEGEEFAVSIMRAIRELYGKRLAYLIGRSNKKR
jgi:hypothetical protein